MIATDIRFKDLNVPDLSIGISPLTELFADVERLIPDKRFVVIIDEFDAMGHPELYKEGPIATPFFETLRSLGTRRNLGLILIGGERMRFVMASHGLALNKFGLVPVDYFDAEQSNDFADLVRAPVKDWLTIDDAAVSLLHEQTAGNPWITHLVAREMFDRQRVGKDAHVTASDMDDAIDAALPKLSGTSFQHFWDDAIQAERDEQHYVSLMRRRVLLALAHCLRKRSLTEEDVVREAKALAVDELATRDILRGFGERNILTSAAGTELRFRVPLFARWLADVGVREIVTTMGDDDALIRRQRLEEAQRPTPAELEALAKKWRTYAGEIIDAAKVGRWLGQFGAPSEQRLMLKLLQRLRYYRMDDLRERLRQLHQYLLRDLAEAGYTYTFKGRERFRSDIVVCGLEGGGSGAGHLVKPYRDENRIFADRAVAAEKVRPTLAACEGQIRAVVVLEDFIATGKTAQRGLEALHADWTKDQPWPEDTPVYLLAICGFDDAVERARRASEAVGWGGRVYVADALDSRDKCFSEDSTIFPEVSDRERARQIAYDRGVRLEPGRALGHDDSQAVVCFEPRCPNNSLPILWKEGRKSTEWTPLFRR